MTSTPPNPRLVKTTATTAATAQATQARVSALVPGIPSAESPVTVFQAGTTGVGAQLTAPTSAFPAGTGYYGVWTAPDLNNGNDYTVQVECFGGGGGGGGGGSNCGGGGGGGGEYAAETMYPVSPFNEYAWVAGVPGSPGSGNSDNNQGATAGGTGGTTQFDIAGVGVAGGVVAHGGQGGDVGNTGIGGSYGTGSINTTVYPGGTGGTNLPGTGGSGTGGQGGTDNPQTLKASGLLTGTLEAWYILDDSSTNGTLNDASGNANCPTPGKYSGSGLLYAVPNIAAQIPAYTGPANPPSSPNPTTVNSSVYFPMQSLSSPCAYILAPGFNFGGSNLGATISCWLYCDNAGVWANNTSGSIGVIAANTTGYYSGGQAGAALYIKNIGSRSNPNWTLNFYCSDGTSPNTITASPSLGTNPFTAYYVVATFNNGTQTLYVNGAVAATGTAAFTTLGVGAYGFTMGMDPTISRDWFFGYMSNLYFAQGTLSSGGVTQAYAGSGGSSTAGGAGGGASGGPASQGGNGQSGSGSLGGAGGTPATQPSNQTGLTTPASAGIAGAAGSSGNAGSGGSYGAGGGGAGQGTSLPNIVTTTVPFVTAASYCGTDAAGGAGGTVYNPVVQGTNGIMFTGGLASDAASGTKNSLLILSPGVQALLSGSTVIRVTLTFTNANSRASQAALLQVGWSSDTFLPASYTGSDIAGSAAAVEIPVGAYTVTADITESLIGTFLANGTATALVLGPGSAPTFQAYSTVTAADFYTAIYGPGATDTAGNSLAPYLTITYAQNGTGTLQQGSSGGSGGILITYVNQAESLVGNFAAQAGTAPNGASYAQGLNATGGQITSTTVVLGTTQGVAGRMAARAGEHFGVRLGTSPSSTNGAVLGYNTGTTAVTQTAPGAYNFTVPSGVFTVAVQCWGAGAGGTGGGRNSYGAGGGGGGAFAGSTSYAVVPGDVIQYAVGAGGAGQTIGSGALPDGGATGFDTTNVAGTGITAYGGMAYRSSFGYGPGGGLSGAPINYTGGNGGPQNFSTNGTGGGGSAGSASRGLGGNSNGGGGTAGGGGGQTGGAAGNSGANGHTGTAPGAGGGGAGAGNSTTSGAGANGKIIISYTSSSSLGVTVATASGVDAAGNAYPTGVMSPQVTLTGTGSAAVAGANSTGSQVVVDGSDGQTYSTQRLSQVNSTTNTFNTTLVSVVSSALAVRTYRISGKIYFSLSTAATVGVNFACPGSTTGVLNWSIVKNSAFVLTSVQSNFNTQINSSSTSGSGLMLEVEGVIFVATAGTGFFQIQCSAGTGTLIPGSFVDFLPVT